MPRQFGEGQHRQETQHPPVTHGLLARKLFRPFARTVPKEVLYGTLPPPDVSGVGAFSPYIGILSLAGGDPGLPPQDQFLFGTGGTGLSFTLGPDTRITNVNALPPGPFQLTGAALPFDAFTGDTIHQYFQMVQQMDCALDEEHVSRSNPTGCLHDLQSAVTATYSTPPGGTPHDTGQTMAFFNMRNGDAPLFKSLADQYTMSDNYHQPVMGGTGPDSQPLGFNWRLGATLSDRSRDNLPNPVQDEDNAYVPRNMPAIGDLFDLFQFDHDGG
jgi:hypothetical protein